MWYKLNKLTEWYEQIKFILRISLLYADQIHQSGYHWNKIKQVQTELREVNEWYLEFNQMESASYFK